ncbi:MAG: 50S ribosomal protein L1 [Candidatus Woesearchaeota archaeon]
MDKKDFLESVKTLRTSSHKRNFNQSVDFIINLQDLDFKKPEHQIDFFVTLQNDIGRKRKICALVGPELSEDAKKIFDKTINQEEFDNYLNNNKDLKKISSEYDYFVAQANIMAKIAQVFGRTLGPRNKMPNPKAGCVVPPKSNLKPLYEKLQKTIRVMAKKSPIIHLCIGKENQSDEILVDNMFIIYDQLVHHLPKEQHNIRSIYVKFTMGKAIKIYPKELIKV